MTYFTIEQLQEIYAANTIHEGVHYQMQPRPGLHEAHLAGLRAVAEALEDKFEDVQSACCQSAADYYSSSHYNS